MIDFKSRELDLILLYDKFNKKLYDQAYHAKYMF